MNTRNVMRNVFSLGAVLLIAGACVGLYWPLMAIGFVVMSVVFGTVYLHYILKGSR